MSKIFVVAAHPDDEVLGCGGTLLKHVGNGDKVFVLFVSDGVSARYKTSEKIKCKNEILKREKKIRAKGCKFIFPLPKLTVV